MPRTSSKPIPWTSEHHRRIAYQTVVARSSAASLGIPGRDRPREIREAARK